MTRYFFYYFVICWTRVVLKKYIDISRKRIEEYCRQLRRRWYSITHPRSCRPTPVVPSRVETTSGKWRTRQIWELLQVPAETITVGRQTAPVWGTEKKMKETILNLISHFTFLLLYKKIIAHTNIYIYMQSIILWSYVRCRV